MGLPLVVVVTAASVQKRKGAQIVLQWLAGSGKQLRSSGSMVVTAVYPCVTGSPTIVISYSNSFSDHVLNQGFAVLPKRWVVERTFAWLNHQRRLPLAKL